MFRVAKTCTSDEVPALVNKPETLVFDARTEKERAMTIVYDKSLYPNLPTYPHLPIYPH